MAKERMNWCRGDVGSYTQGGMARACYGKCRWCGKRVRVTKSGRLYAHGTRPRSIKREA
jgi:hypothetical protein